MTTEVIIKNKSGLVMAADSAVTISNIFTTGKVYNSANKLFSLSKYDPIGILVYNSVNINQIPVEIIIKEYRETLKSKQYPTLEEYFSDFVNFIEKFVNQRGKNLTLENIFDFFLNELGASIESAKNNFIYSPIPFDIDNFLHYTTHWYKNYCKEAGFRAPEDLIENEEILSFISQPQIMEKFEQEKQKSPHLSQITHIDKIKDLFIYYTKTFLIQNFTGIAIGGYGSDDIFPKVYKIHLHGNLNGKLIKSNRVKIENEEPDIIPLAQRQMIDTFIRGVSDDILKTVNQLFELNLDSLIALITDQIKDTCNKTELGMAIKARLKENIKNINEVIDSHEKNKTLISISNLSRDEMAELAETLINLQALKYKVSPDLETVGGPVDVAIISKHDGFVWKKRKLYFPADLNFQFFEKYFKK
nr:MAG TPA: hypothetical protein [Caudoviricetes sp.]